MDVVSCALQVQLNISMTNQKIAIIAQNVVPDKISKVIGGLYMNKKKTLLILGLAAFAVMADNWVVSPILSLVLWQLWEGVLQEKYLQK